MCYATPLPSQTPVSLYLDCSSGISGDMTVAALLDLGASQGRLRSALASLPLDGYRIEISEVTKSSLRARDFHVILDAAHENHDHDMAYLHGHEDVHAHPHEADSAHIHDDAHLHSHGHLHDADDAHVHDDAHLHGHDHPHDADGTHVHDDAHLHDASHHHDHAHGRNLADIEAILRAGSLSPGALALALRIFTIVAEAEAAVHGKPLDEVHFHEVGAVDSIVDIAAVAVCLDDLHIERVIIPSLTEGQGQVRCQHGMLPIPVPAVTQIALRHHLPLTISSVQGELVTPTGAAIAAAIRTEASLPARFSILRQGIGAGKRDYACAGILRAMLITSETEVTSAPLPDPSSFQSDQVLVLQTNLDDCTGEALGYLMDVLLKAGALDVYYQPIQMKKNRPAVLLSVLCDSTVRPPLETLIFRHSTSIGIRVTRAERTKLPRQIHTISTPWGQAQVKSCHMGEEVYCYPEHESIARLADETGLSYSELYHQVKEMARREGPDTGSTTSASGHSLPQSPHA